MANGRRRCSCVAKIHRGGWGTLSTDNMNNNVFWCPDGRETHCVAMISESVSGLQQGAHVLQHWRQRNPERGETPFEKHNFSHWYPIAKPSLEQTMPICEKCSLIFPQFHVSQHGERLSADFSISHAFLSTSGFCGSGGVSGSRHATWRRCMRDRLGL